MGRSSRNSSSSKSHSSSTAASLNNTESDKRSKEIREFQAAFAENKSCFDCGQRGPTYVNMTVGSFVCTRCSGMLRGINPPHRIKSLSMSSFTAEEVTLIKTRGNVWAGKVYTGLYDQSRNLLETKDEEAIKDFIIEKYEKKRYYVDPSNISFTPTAPTTATPIQNNTTTNLIGATLNATIQSRQAHLGHTSAKSSASSNSKNSKINRPPVSNNSSPSQPVTAKPSASNSQQLLAELATPATVTSDQATPIDPFGVSMPQNKNTNSFGTADFFGSQDPASNSDGFANFETANFDVASPVGQNISSSTSVTNISKDYKRTTNYNSIKIAPPPNFIPPKISSVKSILKTRNLPIPLVPVKSSNRSKDSCKHYDNLENVFKLSKNDQTENRFSSAIISETKVPVDKSLNPFLESDEHKRKPLLSNELTKSKLKVTFSPNEPNTVELRTPKKSFSLFPKKNNPSLPNLSEYLNSSKVDEEDNKEYDISMNCLNPFSPNYYPKLTASMKSSNTELKPSFSSSSSSSSSKTTFKSPYRLGEDFFNSLFDQSNFNANKTIITTTSNYKTDETITKNPSVFASVLSNITEPIASFSNKSGPAATASSSGTIGFDNANSSATKQPAKPNQNDKYAALKDLDDIFRSSVIIDSPSTMNSTGANLFGTSPVQGSLMGSSQPLGASNTTSSPPQQQNTNSIFGGISDSSANTFSSVFGNSNSTNNDFTISSGGWPGASSSTAATSPGSDWAWQDKNGSDNKLNGGLNGAKSPPLNPFTGGVTNMTQLNTSPWPTTGNSPVNTANAPTNNVGFMQTQNNSNQQWQAFSSQPTLEKDPFASINLNSDKVNDLFAKAPKPVSTTNNFVSDNDNQLQDQDKSNSNTTFEAFFDNVTSIASQQNHNNGNPWQQKTAGIDTHYMSSNPNNPFL